jgi:hypothetical protein
MVVTVQSAAAATATMRDIAPPRGQDMGPVWKVQCGCRGGSEKTRTIRPNHARACEKSLCRA